MILSLVKAKIKYTSGNYISELLGPVGVQVGDKGICHVMSGYDTTYEVVQVLRTVNQSKLSKGQIITVEEVKMSTDNMFDRIIVSDKYCNTKLCRALPSLELEEGMLVAYEGTDGWMHVGKITQIIRKGVEDRNRSLSFVGYVAGVVSESLIQESKELAARKQVIISQLEERKKEFMKRQVYLEMANTDPSVKPLLDELEAIERGETYDPNRVV